MKRWNTTALALVASVLAVPVGAAVIGKGTVIHSGGNFCTTLTVASFVSNGDNVIVIYNDTAPFTGGGLGLSPPAVDFDMFSYTTFSGGSSELVTVTTYRGLGAGQQYSFGYQQCGPTMDIAFYDIFTDGCDSNPPPPAAFSCRWDDPATLAQVFKFGTESIFLGQSLQRTVRLSNDGGSALTTTLATTCPEFSIASNPNVSIPAFSTATITLQYDASIDDTVAGELFPGCSGSLLVGMAIGPRLVVGTAANVLRRRLDGTADVTMAAPGADHVDLALDAPNRDVYMAKWTASGTGDGIYKGTLDNNFAVIVSTTKPWSVDYDPVAGKVYWGAAGSIRRANANGSVNESLPTPITFASQSPVDIAIDPVGRMLYWTEGTTTISIKRATLDGQGQVTLTTIPSGGNPRLALDRAAGRLYWTEPSAGRIRRMHVDGTSVQTLLTPEIVTPASVAIDATEGTIYWSDQGTSSVHRVDLGGDNHAEIMTGITGLTGLLLMRPPTAETEHIYWADNTSDWIRTALKDGSDPQTLVSSGVTEPRGMAIDMDGGKLYWVDQGTIKRIRRANLDGSSVQDLVTTGLTLPQDIALDVAAGKMYWTDSGGGVQIKRANLDGTGVQNILSTSLDVQGIAVDPVHGKIYWTEIEASEPGIYRTNMDGSTTELLIAADLSSPPLDIELDVASGKMYWTASIASGSAGGAVKRANLEGSDVETLYSTLAVDGGKLRSIALDLGARKVYWSSTNRIRRGNLDGSAYGVGFYEEVVQGLSSGQGLAVAVRAGYPTPTDVDDLPVAAVPRVRLDVPRPNPFNPSTSIAYTHAGGALDVSIYDVRGRLVRTLIAGPVAAGDGTIAWEGKDEGGNVAPSGLYFVKLRSNGQHRIAKAVLVR